MGEVAREWTRIGVVGGLGFVLPAVAIVVALSLLSLSDAPPGWVVNAGAGAAGARWLVYVLAGGTAAATAGPYVVPVLLGCGVIELAIRRPTRRRGNPARGRRNRRRRPNVNKIAPVLD